MKLLDSSPADVLIEEEGEMIVEQLQPDLQIVALLAVCDGPDEQIDEPTQTVLVHRVDVGHVGNSKVEDGRVMRDGLVARPGLVDLGLGLVRNLLLLRDLVREQLGGLQDFNRALVLEDVALAAAKHAQDLVLNLLELLLVLRTLGRCQGEIMSTP